MKINKQFIHSLINDIEFICDEINHNDNNEIQVEDQLFKDLLNVCEDLVNNYK